MILLILDLLQKFDYEINKTNIACAGNIRTASRS